MPNHHKYWTLIAWIQLRRKKNILEPQKKTFILCFYFLFLFWKSLYLHMLWDHAFVYFQFLTSICQLCNCGQASGLLRLVGLLSRTLLEQRSSDLCFPAERIHVFGGSYWIDNAKTYSTNTIADTCELHISLSSWTTLAHRRCSLSMEGENKTNHVLLEVPLWFQVLFCTILVQQGTMSLKQRFFEATEYESGAHQWSGITGKV